MGDSVDVAYNSDSDSDTVDGTIGDDFHAELHFERSVYAEAETRDAAAARAAANAGRDAADSAAREATAALEAHARARRDEAAAAEAAARGAAAAAARAARAEAAKARASLCVLCGAIILFYRAFGEASGRGAVLRSYHVRTASPPLLMRNA